MARPDLRSIRSPSFRPPSSLAGVGVVLLLIVAFAIVWSLWFTVEPEEVGVVLRFGAYDRTVDPGLHFKLPSPIETKILVPVQRQLKQEFGFRTEEAGVRTRYSEASFADESVMLTGDLNVAVVDWIAQYRISEPEKFLFRVKRPEETFRAINEAVLREVVGDRTVNEVLTIGRQEIASEVERRLQELSDQYEMGIKVEQIVLQDVNPPDPVKPSFNEVNQAQQEKERIINEARSEYNRVIPRAKGEAEQVIAQAEGYATDRVNRAQGDAELFRQIAAAYARAPEVTRRRIYLETMGEVLAKVEKKVIVDSDLDGVVPLLPLGSLPKEVVK